MPRRSDPTAWGRRGSPARARPSRPSHRLPTAEGESVGCLKRTGARDSLPKRGGVVDCPRSGQRDGLLLPFPNHESLRRRRPKCLPTGSRGQRCPYRIHPVDCRFFAGSVCFQSRSEYSPIRASTACSIISKVNGDGPRPNAMCRREFHESMSLIVARKLSSLDWRERRPLPTFDLGRFSPHFLH